MLNLRAFDIQAFRAFLNEWIKHRFQLFKSFCVQYDLANCFHSFSPNVEHVGRGIPRTDDAGVGQRYAPKPQEELEL